MGKAEREQDVNIGEQITNNDANNHTLLVAHLPICDSIWLLDPPLLSSNVLTSAADDSPICSWEIREEVG